MKLVVPLTMPRTRWISFAARSAASGPRIGMPPPTAASNRSAAAALAGDRLQLRAVVRERRACWRSPRACPPPARPRSGCRAGSSPPISSTTTSTSGSATRCAGASVTSVGRRRPRAITRSMNCRRRPRGSARTPSNGASLSGRPGTRRPRARRPCPRRARPTRSDRQLDIATIVADAAATAPRQEAAYAGLGAMAPAARRRARPGAGRGRRRDRGARPRPGQPSPATLASRAAARRPGRRPRVRCFSGIQPSGAPHIGNDLGAIRNYVALQDRYESHLLHRRLPRPDEHPRRRTSLRRRTREMAAGPPRPRPRPRACTLFVQSHRPEVTELMWLFTTVTPVSWLERTPTYKEKRENQPDDVNHGAAHLPRPPGRRHRPLQGPRRARWARTRRPTWSCRARSCGPSTTATAPTFPEPQAVYTEAPVVLGTDGVRKMSKSIGQHDRDLRARRRDPAPGHGHGHRHAADQADRPGPPGGLQRVPAPPLLRRRLRGDLGRRADRPDRLRRHQEAARRADPPPLRARPASATRS